MKILMTLLACGVFLISGASCVSMIAMSGPPYFGTILANATTGPVCIRFDPDSNEPTQVIMPGQVAEFVGDHCGIECGDKVRWYYFPRVADETVNGKPVHYLRPGQPVKNYTLVYVLTTGGDVYVVPDDMQTSVLSGKKIDWERLRRRQPAGFPLPQPQEESFKEVADP